jgi:hypothetical protein
LPIPPSRHAQHFAPEEEGKTITWDRAYFYTAAVPPASHQADFEDVVERLFRLCLEPVASLVETNHLTAEELARLNQLVIRTAESGKESDDKS